LLIETLKVGVVIPAYNDADSLEGVLATIPHDLCDLVVVVNDGSTDKTSDVARKNGASVIDLVSPGGPGPAIRSGLYFLRSKETDIVVVMASDGTHDPRQLPDLIRPIVEENLDLVRGSIYMKGGRRLNIPWRRLLLMRIFTVLFSIIVGQRVTDAAGRYQAYRLRILDDPDIELRQHWLGRYEVETYLFAKTVLSGYKWKEVPIQVKYPRTGVYTRARPVADWWGYLRPALLLRLGLKH
jgi:glycosyltransferase involved in cell wall biosynthesis